MTINSLLIANRGEIAIRVMRAAAELGIRTVAVYPADDALSLHVRRADEARLLPGQGAAAYLDIAQMVVVAKEAGCDAVHPGYGFLSESAAFARACGEAGLTFVGPSPETLELFGDKGTARAFAAEHGVHVQPGTSGPTTLEEAAAFMASLGGANTIMVKAIAGGGGRGIRLVERAADLEQAYRRCSSEARNSFGNGDVYVEEFIPRARHIEIQVIGDGSGRVTHAWERECTIQRRNQKLVEIAPAPGLNPVMRDKLIAAALTMAGAANCKNLATFEFLIPADGTDSYAFIEANPRLQVEHTVTEEVTGFDLVKTQLRLATGASLGDLGLEGAPAAAHGFAIQLRVNMETMDATGMARPSGGTLTAFEPPSGPGIRTDTFGYAGYKTSAAFDSLLAKLIVHSPSGDFAEAVRRAYRALCEFRIEGFGTNIPFLQALLHHPEFAANRLYTRFIEEHMAELAPGAAGHPKLFFEAAADAPMPVVTDEKPAAPTLAGAKIDAVDPLAVLDHGKAETARPTAAIPAKTELPAGMLTVSSPLQGTIVSVDVREGDLVRQGQQLFVLESMKMEHVISAAASGRVEQVTVAAGDAVFEGHALALLKEQHVDGGAIGAETAVDLDRVRPDLAEVHRRHEIGLDPARPDAVGRRRKTGQRTARENVYDLCDEGTFTEFGALVIAAQRRRRTVEDLIEKTPADGLISGVGNVNGKLFGDEKSRTVVMSYDYTVLAGTQGGQNHRKTDRLLQVAAQWKLPLVFFTEGGGGRPGDTDNVGVGGLGTMTWLHLGKLSGLVPIVGINSGRCFAGNAAILGCCDVVIATRDSNIGMGGPAMIEGGGLGIFRPEEVGPVEIQEPNGVIDILVEDEAEAVAVAKQYLSYFQGTVAEWECADQRLLRAAVPENRLRVYDMRAVIETMADSGSVLEIRRAFGLGMITSFIRVEGRPVGVIANNPMHNSGAIESDGADKAARFMQLCDAHEVPILFLCDTPGIMVGPEVEKTALVRHSSRMFVTGANITVPTFTIVTRKAYGLGAMTMAGGTFRSPFFAVSWPTGEFGGMGLEGSVKLGYRNELAAIEDPVERRAMFDNMVAEAYERGKAINAASHFELDDVIDPVDSREWIVSALKSIPPAPVRTEKKRPFVDTW